MTTAIAAYTSDGCVGRCDARCHEAKEETCTCICGGRLHGVGADRAVEQNTRDLLGEESVQAFAKRHGLDAGELELRYPPPPAQLELLPA
jgi:hypothetical protein